MNDLLNKLKTAFQEANWLNRLIYINLGVFLLIHIFLAIGYLSGFKEVDLKLTLNSWIALPSDIRSFITRPWTLFTYMFVHFNFWHIFMNLFVLFFSGQIFMDMLGDKRVLPVYLLGGLAGGLLFILMYNISPSLSHNPMIGASAGVMAIMVAAAVKAPNLPVRLFFVLEVKFWMVAAGFIFIDIITLTDGNTGGHLAHLAGAAFGFFYVRGLDNGRDISNWFWDTFRGVGGVFKKKPKLRTVHKRKSGYSKSSKAQSSTSYQTSDQARMDEILDKIKAHGYDKLSKEEKDFLFQFSRK